MASSGIALGVRAVEGMGGAARSPRSMRRHVLDVQASVEDGRLHVDWYYSENLHERSTIDRLAASFLDALRELVSHGRTTTPADLSAADFPLSGLDQERLGRILTRLGKS